MFLELVLISTVTVTSYRSVPEQTDDSPYHTSIGEHVHRGGCAVSRDLLGTAAPYGTWLYVEDVGICRVNDTTNERHRKLVDVWVTTYAEEKAFGVKRRKKLYRIKDYAPSRHISQWPASRFSNGVDGNSCKAFPRQMEEVSL